MVLYEDSLIASLFAIVLELRIVEPNGDGMTLPVIIDFYLSHRPEVVAFVGPVGGPSPMAVYGRFRRKRYLGPAFTPGRRNKTIRVHGCEPRRLRDSQPCKQKDLCH